jgi:uncharacterized membrane protein
MKLLIHFFLTTVLFFAIDILWLGLIAKSFYGKQLGHLLSPQVNWTAAIVFYLIFIGGILFFVVYPHRDASLSTVVLYGVLFGFVTYCTYDLTNLATLKDWPIKVVVVDIIWGMVLTGLVSSGSWWILRLLN